MKKIIELILIFLVSFSVYSQDITRTNTFKRGQYQFDPIDITVDGDTVGTVQDSVDFLFTLNKLYPPEYHIWNYLTKGADTSIVSVILYGRLWTNEPWTTLVTNTWYGLTDTSFSMNYTYADAHKYYDILKLSYISTAGTSAIDSLQIRLYEAKQ